MFMGGPISWGSGDLAPPPLGWHGGCLGAGMHPLHFDIKQGHLAVLRSSWRETSDYGLTPARVDMLRAIMVGTTSSSSDGMLQSTLWRRLGVSNVVVSRMAIALEQLGFIKRSRSWSDRRQLVVSLTELGKTTLRSIYCGTVLEPFIELRLKAAFAKDPAKFEQKWRDTVGRLEVMLAELHTEFGRGSSNPWDPHPDDELFYLEPTPDNPVRVDYVPIWDEAWGPTPPCYEADGDRELPERANPH